MELFLESNPVRIPREMLGFMSRSLWAIYTYIHIIIYIMLYMLYSMIYKEGVSTMDLDLLLKMFINLLELQIKQNINKSYPN